MTTNGSSPAPRCVVLALGSRALSERGWPSVGDDPDAAGMRAARSIAYVTRARRVVVAHRLSVDLEERLRRHLHRALRCPVPTFPSLDPGVIVRLLDASPVVLCGSHRSASSNEAAASDLAVSIGADMLMVLTDEPVVWAQPPGGDPRALRTIAPADVESLGVDPSVDQVLVAATRFVEATGRPSSIGAIDHAEAMLLGEGGTMIRERAPLSYYGPRLPSG